jgi:chromosome segregation ATPase
MNKVKKFLYVIPLFMLSLALATTGSTSSRSADIGTGTETNLQELLDEVRKIRKVVQANRLDAYRGLMIVERLRLQQEHVDRLTRQLDELRLDLSNMETQIPTMQDRVKDFEAQVDSEQDTTRKGQLTSELRAFKSLLDQQLSQHQAFRERDAQLSVQVQSEQDKLNELTQKLEAYERAGQQ